MWDEMPMLWTVAILLFILFEQPHRTPCYCPALPLGLAVYAAVATYATSMQGGSAQWFSFHTFFAGAEFLALYKVMNFFRGLNVSQETLCHVMKRGFAAYLGAIVVWLTDLNLCKWLQTLPAYDCWNLHACGWYGLVSYGLFSMMIGVLYDRLQCVLGVNVILFGSVIPRLCYVKSE